MPLSFNLSRYFPEDAHRRLALYQYHGEDHSYIYQWFWRPVCRTAVNMLPMWLAPNVITVLGLLFVIVSHFSLWYYVPNLTVEGETNMPPTWIYFFAAFALIVYQFLDNLDGHQARRTGMSSPLGLLMDHGCDAVNSCFSALTAASVVSLGPTWKTWSIMMVGVVAFFANTLEEYYRGTLVLPVINGPNEGIFILVGCYLLTGVMGPQLWLKEFRVSAHYLPSFVPDQFRDNTLLRMTDGFDWQTHEVVFHLNTALLGFILVSGFITVLGNVYQLWKATSGSKNVTRQHGAKYGVSWLCRNYPFLHGLTRAIPLAGISILANLWFFYSPTDVYRAHPRLFCWTAGLLYAKLTIHLMIAHLCGIEFHPFRRTLVPFFAIGAHWFCSFVGAKTMRMDGGLLALGDEGVLLLEFFALSVTAFCHLAVNAILECSEALDLPVWTVPASKRANKQK